MTEKENTSPLADDDESVMGRVKRGDVGELDALFRRHSGPLFGFFYGLSRDAPGSEDLVQEVFWRVLRHRENYGDGRSFRGWIYGIARNLMADRYRRKRRVLEVDVSAVRDLPDVDAANAFQVSARTDERGRLQQAMSALPPEQREILLMARFEELSFREIGEVLGCREGTAKVRAFRALRALRKQYQALERTQADE